MDELVAIADLADQATRFQCVQVGHHRRVRLVEHGGEQRRARRLTERRQCLGDLALVGELIAPAATRRSCSAIGTLSSSLNSSDSDPLPITSLVSSLMNNGTPSLRGDRRS